MLGTAIETKFLPTYASSFLNKLESDVLKSRELTPFNWYFSTDNVFFIWTHGDEKHASLSNVLSNYHPSIKFTHESNKERIPFLELNVKLVWNKLSTDLYVKSIDMRQSIH